MHKHKDNGIATQVKHNEELGYIYTYIYTQRESVCERERGYATQIREAHVSPQKTVSTPHHSNFFLHQYQTPNSKFVVFLIIPEKGHFCLGCYYTANLAVIFKRKCSAIAQKSFILLLRKICSTRPQH